MGKILVTGGMGYIGSHTVIELLNQNHEIDIVDNLFNSKENVLDKIEKITGKRPGFFNIDLRNYTKLSELFKNNQYDLVIHFAGLKAVGESVEKPLEYYENNVGGTMNLLKCMKNSGVNKIIFSSSATVYGIQNSVKYNETMTTGVGITNPYGRTKYMIEEILKDEAVTDKNFAATILRYFNPIGNHSSGLIGEDPNDTPNNLMPIIMKVYQGRIEKFKVYGNDYDTPDGSGIRDYIHVVDLAKGHVAAMKNMEPGISIYNLGSGKGTSVFEMIKAFNNASGEELPYEIVNRRPGDLAEYFADSTKAEKELNWKTELTIEDAMRDTITFLHGGNF